MTLKAIILLIDETLAHELFAIHMNVIRVALTKDPAMDTISFDLVMEGFQMDTQLPFRRDFAPQPAGRCWHAGGAAEPTRGMLGRIDEFRKRERDKEELERLVQDELERVEHGGKVKWRGGEGKEGSSTASGARYAVESGFGFVI